MAHVAGVEVVGKFAMDAEEDEADVAGLWRPDLTSQSMFSLPTASGEEGFSKDIRCVE